MDHFATMIYLLTKDKTVIGRGSGCDIVIDDPGISRKHLEIDITSPWTFRRCPVPAG